MNRGIKKYVDYILDILLLLTAVTTVFNSYVVWFILPHGRGVHGDSGYCNGGGVGSSGNNELFLGWCRLSWIRVHIWVAVVLAVIILAHIILHWGWILATTKRITSHLKSPPERCWSCTARSLPCSSFFGFNGLSGLVIWLVLPRGARDYNLMISGAGRTFLGLQRNIWADLHAWVAVVIVSIIIVHLILNWSWVVAVSKKTIMRSLRVAR